MKGILRSISTIVSTALVFALLFIIPTMLIPVSEDLLKSINPEEMRLFFPLLLIVSLYISVTYYLLLKNTEKNRTTLFFSYFLRT